MSLYTRLKPSHIQQITKAGCSLASYLMIRNSILGTKQTQLEFRDELETRMPGWFKATSTGGSGVSPTIFLQYIITDLKYLNNGYTFKRISCKNFDLNEFENFLDHVSRSNDKYIIFHFTHHYSPFAELTKSKEVKIFDVDFNRSYGDQNNEYYYKDGSGEIKFDLKHFYNLQKKQKKYIILIQKKI